MTVETPSNNVRASTIVGSLAANYSISAADLKSSNLYTTYDSKLHRQAETNVREETVTRETCNTQKEPSSIPQNGWTQ